MILELQRIEAPFVFQITNEKSCTTVIDASESIGGKNKGLRPMEMLASSLAACASIDVLLMLEKQREDVEHFSVRILANRAEEIPAKFKSIELVFSCDPKVERKRLERNIQLALDKYCSVAASLNTEIKLCYSIEEYETSGN